VTRLIWGCLILVLSVPHVGMQLTQIFEREPLLLYCNTLKQIEFHCLYCSTCRRGIDSDIWTRTPSVWLQHAVTHCNTLNHIVIYCLYCSTCWHVMDSDIWARTSSILLTTVIHCSTHCNTQCNTLKHIVTHCVYCSPCRHAIDVKDVY